MGAPAVLRQVAGEPPALEGRVAPHLAAVMISMMIADLVLVRELRAAERVRDETNATCRPLSCSESEMTNSRRIVVGATWPVEVPFT
jgi:hypothetical protein